MHSRSSDSGGIFLRASIISSIGALGTAVLGMTALLILGNLASLVTFAAVLVAAASVLAHEHLNRNTSRNLRFAIWCDSRRSVWRRGVTSGLGVGGYLWAMTGSVWPSPRHHHRAGRQRAPSYRKTDSMIAFPIPCHGATAWTTQRIPTCLEPSAAVGGFRPVEDEDGLLRRAQAAVPGSRGPA